MLVSVEIARIGRSTGRVAAFLLLGVQATCSEGTAPRKPAALHLVAGVDSARNGLPFSIAPIIEVLAGDGEPLALPGIVVAVSITSGGGLLTGATSATTDSTGRVAFDNLLVRGKTGQRSLSFSSAGLTSAFLPLMLRAGTPVGSTPAQGDGQIGIAGSTLPINPAMLVVDADSNGVPGIAVEFAVAAGSGVVENQLVTTGPAGLASPGKWTLGAIAGQNRLTATASGLPTISFTALGAAGAPTRLILLTRPSSGSSRVPLAVQPVLQVVDDNGNAVSAAGTVVTASISAGGGAVVAGSTATTGANGIATFAGLALAGTTGARRLSFSANGLTSDTASVQLHPGPARAIAKLAGDNATAIVRASTTPRPSVKISDEDGNGVPGVTITFAVTAGGGSVAGGSQVTDSTGVATVGSWLLGPAVGHNTLTAAADGIATSVTFVANATPDPTLRVTTRDSVVATSGGTVNLPTGTAARVGTPPSGPAILMVTESGGDSPASGRDTSRHIAVELHGAQGDSATISMSIVVDDMPTAGAQWVFVHREGDPPEVGRWYHPNPPASPSGTLPAVSILTIDRVVIVAGIKTAIALVQPPPHDPASCRAVRAFKPHPALVPVKEPALTVLVIHGWQADRACPGTFGWPGGFFDTYQPQDDWYNMAVTIRAAIPRANVYFVRYSTTAPIEESATYIREQLTALNKDDALTQVVLVGHSMGGLVSRYVVRDGAGGTGVVKLISLGTPHLGTPAALPFVVDGWQAFYPSDGLAGLRPLVVNDEIPLPGPFPPFAIRGGVQCSASVNGTLVLSHIYLCVTETGGGQQNVVSDGIVPSRSAIPEGTVSGSLVLPGNVDHMALTRNSNAIAKVIELLNLLPRIRLSSDSLVLRGERGQVTPSVKSIAVSNAGTSLLTGITATVKYGAGSPAGWLEATLKAGVPDSLVVSASVGNLEPGTYRATVSVASNATGVTNSPKELRIIFDVANSNLHSLAAGSKHTCGLNAAGHAFCWGYNGHGEFGNGTVTGSVNVPTPSAAGLTFWSLSAGNGHTCGLAGGGAYCWGLGFYGALGAGNFTSYSVPVGVVGGGSFQAVSAGSYHTCGLSYFGAAYCWGFNSEGETGAIKGDTVGTVRAPRLVRGGHAFLSVSAGGFHSCGVATDGLSYCWGYNKDGSLGTLSSSDSVPRPVVGPAFTSIVAGPSRNVPPSHSCGLTAGGAMFCWGDNRTGQLGDGSQSSYGSAVAVAGGHAFRQMALGVDHTCALDIAGSAWCWGDNAKGQLGDGTKVRRLFPVQVKTDMVFTRIVAGEAHTCAESDSGVAYCWGFNGYGQLGDGTFEDRTVPTPVRPAR